MPYSGPPAGVNNWGGGAGPTGLRNSPTIGTSGGKPPFLVHAINRSLYVIIATANVPVPAQAMNVPPGAAVGIRAHNGTEAGNQKIVRIAGSPEELSNGGGDPLTPDTEISWPCDHLGQIWIAGANVGDGVRISIQGARA